MNHHEALDTFFHPRERDTVHFTFIGEVTVREAAQDSGDEINDKDAIEASPVVEPTDLTDID